jgi:parallel beta-helix repeat protein
MRALALGLSTAALSILSACHSTKPACDGVTATCTPLEQGASESAVAAAFAQAQPGSTVAFGAGTFRFTNTLNLAAKNVTIKGAGIDQTVLDFKDQAAGAQGIYVQDHSDGVLLVDFTLRNTKGDGIKVIGSAGVTFRRVKVDWQDVPQSSAHAGYGLYPVQSTNVLVEDSVVIGAADAGIYVGQSQNIIVRGNRVSQSVAGIEIENCYSADVHDNTSTDNTAGLLVFDLPNLQQQGGHNIRVFNNTMKANNRTNFAAAGSTVSIVPAGTGFFVMANHDVEVFGNTITDNGTGGVAVISYLITQNPITDQNYNPFPHNIYIHDNTMSGNGANPDPNTSFGTLFLLNKGAFTGGVIPAQLFDGILPPNSTGANPTQICFKNNAGGFANLHLDQVNGPTDLGKVKSEDATPYTCELPPLPPVAGSFASDRSASAEE